MGDPIKLPAIRRNREVCDPDPACNNAPVRLPAIHADKKCCDDDSGTGLDEINEDYPWIGYYHLLSTYTYNLSGAIYPNDWWIWIDDNFEYVGTANTNAELLALLMLMELGDFSLNGNTLTASGYHKYGRLKTTPPGSVVDFIYGCTVMAAPNYDPDADINDGSCLPVIINPVYGCMDVNANNWSGTATADTVPSSCTYNPTVSYNYIDVICQQYTITQDINYQPGDVGLGIAADSTLVMDSYVESCNTNTSRPIFICLHGGGGTYRNLGMISWCKKMASRGFYAVSIQYGETGLGLGFTLERQKQAVINLSLCIRYIRAHAVALGVNPLNVVTYGVSAGGITAAQQNFCSHALDAGDPFFASSKNLLYAVQSSSVSASSSAPGSADGQFLDRLDATAAPHHFYNGTLDPKIPYNSAVAVYNTMLSLGIGSTLVAYVGDGHGLGSHDSTIELGGDQRFVGTAYIPYGSGSNVFAVDEGLVTKFSWVLV